MRKKELETLMEKLTDKILRMEQKTYQIIKIGNPEHNHSWNNYELTSDSGIAFCDWKCECGAVVSQTLGERTPPEKVPSDKQSWREG